MLLLLAFHVNQAESTQTTKHRLRRELPFSMDKEMFPPQDFDEEAPICMAEREPCGFYSFSLDGKAPLKWIKSWCRCSPKHECVYERTDLRMRVYRQTCVPKNLTSRTTAIQQNQQYRLERLDAEPEQQQQEEKEQEGNKAVQQNANELDEIKEASGDMKAEELLLETTTGKRVEEEHDNGDDGIQQQQHHSSSHHHNHHHRHIRKANRRMIRSRLLLRDGTVY